MTKQLSLNSHFISEGDGIFRARGILTEQAICDMAKRLIGKQFKSGNMLSKPEVVKDFFIMRLAKLEHEVFSVAFLNSKNRLIYCDNMFRGTINSAFVYPREVVKAALLCNAASVILAHNHPSGDPTPSDADHEITIKLISALEIIDIKVLDHIVVGGINAISFADMKYL